MPELEHWQAVAITDPAIRRWFHHLTGGKDTDVLGNMRDPRGHYDYEAAIKAGNRPEIGIDGQYHWSSEFKKPGHPTYHLKFQEDAMSAPIGPPQQVAPGPQAGAMPAGAPGAAGMAGAQANPQASQQAFQIIMQALGEDPQLLAMVMQALEQATGQARQQAAQQTMYG